MNKVLIISDLHVGHVGGLCHPDHIHNDNQQRAWDYFWKGILENKPFTHVIANGDLLDGKGVKNAVEQIITDRQQQAEVCIKILKEINRVNKQPINYAFIRGTPAHVAQDGEQWEDIVAKDFINNGSKKPLIDNTLLLDIGGVQFDCRHKIGKSSVPWGRSTPIIRAAMWKAIGESLDFTVCADIFIRSHIHYFVFVEMMGLTMLSTPALQYWSGYGARECEGITDFGFLVAEIQNKKITKWIKHIARQPIIKDKVIKI
jgi:hypothetical protein